MGYLCCREHAWHSGGWRRNTPCDDLCSLLNGRAQTQRVQHLTALLQSNPMTLLQVELQNGDSMKVWMQTVCPLEMHLLNLQLPWWLKSTVRHMSTRVTAVWGSSFPFFVTEKDEMASYSTVSALLNLIVEFQICGSLAWFVFFLPDSLPCWFLCAERTPDILFLTLCKKQQTASLWKSGLTKVYIASSWRFFLLKFTSQKQKSLSLTNLKTHSTFSKYAKYVDTHVRYPQGPHVILIYYYKTTWRESTVTSINVCLLLWCVYPLGK